MVLLSSAGQNLSLIIENYVYALAKDLGIEQEMITSNTGPTYIAVGSQLYPIPSNLLSGATPHVSSFITSGLFSLSGKVRAAGIFSSLALHRMMTNH